MTIFSVISLIAGLTFFLYGMNVMSSGFEKLAGGKLENSLKKMTSNLFRSMTLGAGITIAIQSSSAVTVMLVGLVNSGIMKLGQTVGVIMGSNIGTTLTAWILSLTGIESSNIWIKFLKPENFSPILALIGIVLLMLSKKKKNKDIGNILVGFAILMFGMKLMSDSVSPLAESPQFASILTAFENPIIGVIVGAVFTGIIQSSAASVGVLQALALTGNITYGMAIPIIMGQNIGTCVTSLISSIGVSKNAKRVAIVHISFNIIGTVICMALFYGLNAIFHFPITAQPIGAVGIAAVHSIFNVFTTGILMPFTKTLEKIALFLVKDSKTQEKYSFLDQRLLNTPSVAIAESSNMTVKMCELSKNTIIDALNLFNNYSPQKADIIIKNEDEIDMYEDKLGTFLVKLSSNDISEYDSKQISRMLHTIGDFERLGDHAVNLVKVAQEIYDKKLNFSEQANKEIGVLTTALKEILELTSTAYANNDEILAKRVEPLEQVIDVLISEIKVKHIERLQAGNCSIQMGFILSDLLTNYSRVSDHCSNIAVAIIEVSHNSFDTHSYLSRVKTMEDNKFKQLYEEFSAKYAI